MSADPAVWLRAADDAEQRANSSLTSLPACTAGTWRLIDHLRAAAGEVTRLLDEVDRLTAELADVRAAAIECCKVAAAPDPALRARGIRLGVRALLAGAGDAEGGDDGQGA